MPADTIAMDRSARTIDDDGRLRVKMANISKANICPYWGREIPDAQALGLDPDRTYYLLRHPNELVKAAPSFNGIPILAEHRPVTAEDHDSGLVVGTTGSDAVFEAPYLRNSLVIWTQAAIDDVETEKKRELSCGYRYRADMTPGTWQGQPYDGVMRDIVGNHVALVAEGRAGPDVVVADAQPPDLPKPGATITRLMPAPTLTGAARSTTETSMRLSPKASAARAALTIHLRPRLAADAQIDLAPALAGVTAKNFGQRKPGILAAVQAAAAGKLATDANLDDVMGMLDALESEDIPDPAEDLAPNSGMPMGKESSAKDAGPMEKLMAFLKGKISDEDCEKLKAMMAADDWDQGDMPAQDEPPPFPGKPEVGGKMIPETKPKTMVTKAAMDAAITAALDADRQRHTATREAEKIVRPYVGELAIAHDTAEGVYGAALKTLGIKIDGVHPSAYRTILEMQPKPGSTSRPATRAMDAAGAKGFADRFPDATRIRSA